MIHFLDKVKVLVEVRSLLKSFVGRVVVIKYGGAVMKDLALTLQLIEDIILLHFIGVKVILVHGGGPEINVWLSKMNIKPSFHHGIRITDSMTMDIVEMVLVGRVNKTLVKFINKYNVAAVGISGQDGKLIIAKPIDSTKDNLVANVQIVNPLLINTLLNNNYIPVIAPVASDKYGQTYNINADIVAGEIASALQAYALIILTDTPGILLNPPDINSRVSNLDLKETHDLIQNRIISGGMLPKVNSCVHALLRGVYKTSIIDGRASHSLLLYLLTSKSIGSTIVIS